MKRQALYASIVAAMIAITAPAIADDIQLPTGSGPQGSSTGIAFWRSSANVPGTFQGIRIERMDPQITRVQVVDQFGNRAVLYDGPIQPGQFIPFTQLNVAWTAWSNTPGTNGGVKALIVYN